MTRFDVIKDVVISSARSPRYRADVGIEDGVITEIGFLQASDISCVLGEMYGRDAIYDWIQSTMTTPPIDEMQAFPIEWYVIDEERGWVGGHVWNRMNDPGDGSAHQAYNLTLLKNAGDGRWSYEEDIYNPKPFQDMIRGRKQVKKRHRETVEPAIAPAAVLRAITPP